MAKEGGTVDVGKASPPVGSAYEDKQKSGERGFGKESWSRPGEQPVSDRAYKNNQASGTRGFSSNKVKF
jgi:hypothetical protein